MSQLMARCADLLSSLYAPVPEDADDEDAGDTTTYSSNSTREMERGNRHVRENTLLGFHIACLNIFLQLHTFLVISVMRLGTLGTLTTIGSIAPVLDDGDR